VVLATRNQHKIQEIRALLADMPIRFLSLADFPDLPEVVEDGTTCQENAVKKARETAAGSGHWALADDTGLEVQALDGRPGVYAARYAGEQATYTDNCNKLLEELQDIPIEQRGAKFLTVMALADPHGKVEVVEVLCRAKLPTDFTGAKDSGMIQCSMYQMPRRPWQK